MSTNRTQVVPALVAAAALAITFAGSATATGLISGKQIKDGSVHGVDLRDNGVGRADLQRTPLSGVEIADGYSGPDGPAGDPGTTGDLGPVGPAGVSDLRYTGGTAQSLAPGQFAEVQVSCSGRHYAVHGGVVTSPADGVLRIQESAPSNGHTTWVTRVTNTGPNTVTVQGWAVCVDAG